MRRRPSVDDARRLCEALGSRGVVVLALDEGHVAGASYGQTRRECHALGAVLDRVVAEFEGGRFDWPPERRTR